MIQNINRGAIPPLLTSEWLDVEAVCFGREDQEGNDGYVRLVLFQQVVEPGQSLYEDIRAFVTELVTAGREEIKALKLILITTGLPCKMWYYQGCIEVKNLSEVVR